MTKSKWIEFRSTLMLLAIGSIAAYFIYYGMHDGTVPLRHGKWTTYAESPIRYIVEMSGFSIVAAFCIWNVINLPIRLKEDQNWIEQKRNAPTFEQPEFSAGDHVETISTAGSNRLEDDG